MRNTFGWIALICLSALTLFGSVLLVFGQFGHDFVVGGPNPPSLWYGWLMLALKIGSIAVSRRSGIPLILVGLIDWMVGIAFFQMYRQHLSFGVAVSDSWLDFSFVLFAVVYVATTGRWNTALRRS